MYLYMCNCPCSAVGNLRRYDSWTLYDSIALQRFISRKNTPDTIILDKAPHFELTKTTIDKSWQQSIIHKNVEKFTSDAGIKWKFIIEFSPWMGGFYERLVGMVKSLLRKVIQRKFLTATQFRTYAIGCEQILIQDRLYTSMTTSDRQKQ